MTGHEPGEAFTCLSIPIVIEKEAVLDAFGQPLVAVDGAVVLRCGFRIGGGIDQDYRCSPQQYTDSGVYVTAVDPGGPAWRAGLLVDDKILQVNGRDFTIVTHMQAVDFIRRKNVLSLLVYRSSVEML